MIRAWNKADMALFISFVSFLISLYLHVRFQDNIYAQGLLTVSEAALVGGVADWFAVTALFCKPLGFPYHTEILPRRRDSFIQAIVVMVQKEFFSRRKIFHHLEKMHLMPMFQEYLRKKETEERWIRTTLHFLRTSFFQKKNTKIISQLSIQLKKMLMHEDPHEFMDRFTAAAEMNAWDKKALIQIADLLANEASTEDTRHSIRAALAELEHEKIGEGFLSRLLEATNTLNLDEGASLIQEHLCSLLDELRRDGSPLQEQALIVAREGMRELCKDTVFLSLLRELQELLTRELPLEETMTRIFFQMNAHVRMDFHNAADPVEEHFSAFYQYVKKILHIEYQHVLFLIMERKELQNIITKVIYDLLARSALHAQTLVGVIVGNVLSRLTDQQLNHLIYDKVEEDFLWIRINGTVVGAGIGLFIFIGQQIFV